MKKEIPSSSPVAPTTWKTVKVFISSTFRDMQAERDWLVKRVFPALRQRLEPYRIHLVDIDLRWGITAEQAQDDRVLALCLEQIEECRPFFLGLIGELYGWVPTTYPVEAGSRHGWTQQHTGKSVTELEILHGVLNEPTMHGRALFAFRSADFLAQLDAEQRSIFGETPTADEQRALGREEAERRADRRRALLAALKQRIRELPSRPQLFDGYPCRWAGRVAGLESFGVWVRAELERAILRAPELRGHLEAVAGTDRDSIEEERAFHERFIEGRTRVYIGRESLQRELRAFVESDELSACLVSGPSGSGKSATLARCCQGLLASTVAEASPPIVLTHFIGASPRSTNVREMLTRLCTELRQALGLDEAIQQDMRELPGQLRDFLAKVPAHRRCVLVIDALNQLDETDRAHELFWLPWTAHLPAHVRVIVSCLDDPGRPAGSALLAMRHRAPREIAVPLLDAGDAENRERREILRAVPSLAAKTLDDAQIALLLRNEATRNPLFLLVALEELRGFGSFEKLNERIRDLPCAGAGDPLTALFRQVIARLGTDFDATTVRDVLTLLACARRGLSERELLDLIEGEEAEIEASASDLFAILRQLRPYLLRRGALLGFFHQHLTLAVAAEYLPENGAAREKVHLRLAEYFSRRAWALPADGPVPPELDRKVDELPWHWLHGGDGEQLAALLLDFDFLETKSRAHRLGELLEDFAAVLGRNPAGTPRRELMHLLHRGLQRESSFLLRRAADAPHALFQTLWNLAVAERTPPGHLTRAQTPATTLEAFLRTWLAHKAQRTPGFPWLRACEPPALPLDSSLIANLRSTDRQAVTAVAFSRDGKRFALGSAGGAVDVWESESRTLVVTLRANNLQVYALAFSDDGTLLASGGIEKKIHLWNLRSQTKMAVLAGSVWEIHGLQFSADGSQLLSVSEASVFEDPSWEVCVWSVRTGETEVRVASSAGAQEREVSAALAGNGRQMAVALGKSVRLYALPGGHLLEPEFEMPDEVHAVGFASDTATLEIALPKHDALFGPENPTRMATIKDGAVLEIALLPRHAEARQAPLYPHSLEGGGTFGRLQVFSRSAGLFLQSNAAIEESGAGGVVTLWHAKKPDAGEPTQPASRPPSIRPILSAGGKWLAFGCTNAELEIWDLATAHVRRFRCGEKKVHSLRFSPTDDTLALGLEDASVLLISIPDARTLAYFQVPAGVEARARWSGGAGFALAFSADGSRFASGTSGRAIVWDVKTAAVIACAPKSNCQVLALAMAPDGSSLACTTSEPALELRKIEAGQPLPELWRKPLVEAALHLVFPTVDRIEVTCRDVPTWTWGTVDLHSAEPPREWAIDGEVEAIALAPEHGLAVVGKHDGTLTAYELHRGDAQWSTSPEPGAVTLAAIHGASVIHAIAGSPELKICDLATGRLRATLPLPAPPRGLELSADGGKAAVLLEKDALLVCDLVTGQHTSIFPAHEEGCQLMTLDEKGYIVAALVAHDFTIRTWSTATGEQLSTTSADRFFGRVHPMGGGTSDRDLHLWNLQRAHAVRLAFAEGQLLLAATNGGAMQIIEVATARPLLELTGHRTFVTVTAFSPGAQWLATGAGDFAVGAWDLRRRKLLGRSVVSPSTVTMLAIEPDGRRLVYAGFTNQPAVFAFTAREGASLQVEKPAASAGAIGWRDIDAYAALCDHRSAPLAWHPTSADEFTPGPLPSTWESDRAGLFELMHGDRPITTDLPHEARPCI